MRELNPYSRTCPRCRKTFSAVTDRGVCPGCGLFTRIDRAGELVTLVESERMGNLPSRDETSAPDEILLILELVEFGGGPIVEGKRYDRFPAVSEVHRALLHRFNHLREELARRLPSIEYDVIDDPRVDADWIGTVFEESEALHVLSWLDRGARIDILCDLAADGGAIHAITPDSTYHFRSPQNNY